MVSVLEPAQGMVLVLEMELVLGAQLVQEMG